MKTLFVGLSGLLLSAGMAGCMPIGCRFDLRRYPGRPSALGQIMLANNGCAPDFYDMPMMPAGTMFGQPATPLFGQPAVPVMPPARLPNGKPGVPPPVPPLAANISPVE